MPLPDAVDHDARGEGVGRIGDPGCQFPAATPGGDGGLRGTGEDHRETLGNEITLILRVATDEYLLLDDRAFRDGASERRLGRAGVFELFQLALESCEAGAGFLADQAFALFFREGEGAFASSHFGIEAVVSWLKFWLGRGLFTGSLRGC